MLHRVIKIALVVGSVLSLLGISSVQAVIIDNGSYTTDSATGLDWLDLSETDDLSYTGALSLFSSYGWVGATESQFEGLIDSMFSEYSGNTSGYMLVSKVSTTFNEAMNFKNLFGSTCVPTNSDCSYGLYNVNGQLRLGGVYTYDYGAYVYRDHDANYGDTNFSHPNMGIFLVRNTVSVAEPASIALMGLALSGLGYARRKKKY